MHSEFKYLNLANKIREEIAAGKHPAGSKLPTEEAFTKEYHVSRQTVRQALALLKNEGYIEKLRGSGSVVKDRTAVTAGETGRKTVAVITTYISEYIFPDILRSIEKVVMENHYLTMIFATQNRVDNERRILMEVLNQPLAGIIIEGTKTALPNPNIDLYNELERRNIPLVFIHSGYPELTAAVRVMADDKKGGEIATEYLIANGHQKIAGIFKSDDMQGHLRYAGYTQAMRANSLPVVDDNVLWYTTESKELITVLGLQVTQGCTAVLCYNDEIAIQLLGLFRDSGIQVPDDISMMSFDNSTYSELAVPKLSSCSQQKKQIGIQAAEKLFNLIHDIPEESSLLPWRVVGKNSVRNIMVSSC